MNKLMAVLMAAPVAIVAPCATAAATAQHPAQVQFQQNMDAVLAVARNPQLSEAQKVQRIDRYADQYLDYQRISALAVGLPVPASAAGETFSDVPAPPWAVPAAPEWKNGGKAAPSDPYLVPPL